VVHLGAGKSQLVATTVPYIYIIFMSPEIGNSGVFLHVRCILHHQFAKMFLSKCVCVCVNLCCLNKAVAASWLLEFLSTYQLRGKKNIQ